MPIYTYPSGNIHSWNTAYKACVKEGHPDSSVSLGALLVIDSDMSQAEADSAASNAEIGSLFSSKEDRISEVSLRSSELSALGYTYVRPSDSAVQGPFEISHEERHRLRNLKDDVADSSVPLPQSVMNLNGLASPLYTSADVNAIYQSLLERGIYIYGNGGNGDGSSGEAAILASIDSAADQAALDAILDTRS